MSIKVKNISFKYNKKDNYVLKNISFDINDNDFVAIVGKTGAGKSTLIELFNGINHIQEGEILIDDLLLNKKTKKNVLSNIRKKVGLVFQFPEYQLFEDTVLKDVMFAPKNFKIDNDLALKYAKEALNNVGVREEYYEKSPLELSGGEKKRVAIAGILSFNPDILIFDEPTVGLDPISKENLMKLICNLHQLGKTIILVTHDMEIVNSYCKKVILLDDGSLIFNKTPKELFSLDENKLNKYNLEKPLIYKFKDLLKKYNFKGNLDNINNIGDIKGLLKNG